MMKKQIRKLACILICICLLTSLATVANATTRTDITIYVNGSRIRGVDIYDLDGDIYVSSNDDLAKIFTSAELGNSFYVPDIHGILLEPIIEEYGYVYMYSDNTLYLTKPPDTPVTTTVTSTTETTQPYKNPIYADVFVNGLRINGISAYLSNGEACINDYLDLYELFPKETKNTHFAMKLEETSLSSWAKRYEYSFIQNENRVYLNNDGKTPIEVTLDGNLVEFEDQQAVVVNPGRTLVPIRTISEILKCDVTWDDDNNRVVIKGNGISMVLWINNKTYWLNGNYYLSDVSPIICNDRTLVPLRLISETFGLNVEYKSGTIGTAVLSS